MASPQPDEAIKQDEFHTEQVLTIAGGHFTHDTSSAFYAPLIPLIQEKLSLSYGSVGILAMLIQLPGLITPFIGYLADRVSVRYFVIFAPAVTATFMSLLGLAPSFLALAIMLFAAGISVACFHAPSPSMIANVSGDRIGTGMGFYMAGGELGRTIGPLVVAGGVAWFGLEGIWRLMFAGWAVSAFLFFRLRNVKVPMRASSAFPWRRGIKLFSLIGWFQLLRTGLVGAVSTFLPTYMTDVAISSFWLAAGSLTIVEAAGVAGALLSGNLSDRYGRFWILLFLVIVAPLILIGFLYSPTWTIIPLLLLLGFTVFSTAPIMLAIVQEEFVNDRAFANGIFMFLNFLILGLGVFLVGISADQFGLKMTYFLAAVMSLLCIPAVFFLPEQSSRET